MSQSFAPAEIEERLKTLYSHWPNVATLRELAVSLGHRLGIQSPAARTRMAPLNGLEQTGVLWNRFFAPRASRDFRLAKEHQKLPDLSDVNRIEKAE
jgi:hypothetical protein